MNDKIIEQAKEIEKLQAEIAVLRNFPPENCAGRPITRTIKDLEQMFAAMDGERLLNELTVFAAMFLDAHHNDEEDNIEAILRAIYTQLAKTGIAQRQHSKTCRFMAGEDSCSWSWPQKSMDDPRVMPQHRVSCRSQLDRERGECGCDLQPEDAVITTACSGFYIDFQGATRVCSPNGEGCCRTGCRATQPPSGGG